MSSLKLDVPSSWMISSLTDIAAINMGQSPSSSDVNERGDGLVFFQGKAEFGKLYPTPKKYCTKPTKIASEGDVLLSIRAPVGPTNIATEKTAIGRGLAAISAYNGLTHPKYLLYYFRNLEPWLSTQGTGSTFKAISGQFIKELIAPLPSISEQKIIADKLDTLLDKVDSTKARLEQIPQILKRFRQAVLAAAVSGKLTGELWGTHVWRNFSIGQLAKNAKYSLGIGPFGSNLKVNDYKTEGHPLVFVRDIRSGIFGGVNTKYVNEDKFNELKAHRVKPGDVLITKMGDPPGDVAIYPLHQPEAIITSDCIKISLNESLVLTKFVLYTMMSEQFRAKVLSISAGVAQQKVNLKNFKNIDIDIPSLEEQTEIVRRVEQLFAYADGIEKQVQNALERVNNLTQSILAKAFRGELTAQWRAENPDLISGENSAQALLAKIQQQRANTKTAKRGSSKR